MGIGESLLYSSEFSDEATKRLRRILGASFSTTLAADLSCLRYSLANFVHSRRGAGLTATERRKIQRFVRALDQQGLHLRVLSATVKGSPSKIGSRDWPASIKRRIRDSVTGALWRTGRHREFRAMLVPEGRSEGFTYTMLRRVPDIFERAAGDLQLVADSLRTLASHPRPGGRPRQLSREFVAAAAADVLKRHRVSVTKYRDGVYARVLVLLLAEFGLPAPTDRGRLVRLCVDTAKDPAWVSNLLANREVSPLPD